MPEANPRASYGVFWLDLQGRITRWTPEAALLYTRPDQSALGQHFRELFTEEDRREGRPERALEQARETGVWDDIGWKATGDRRRFWAASSVTLVRTPNEVPIGHMVVTRDLSTLSGTLTESPDEGAARLMSLGRVASEVCHDVSNILTAIRGFAGLLERELVPGGMSHQVWFELLKACDRGTDLTSRALSAGSQGDSTGPEDVDIAESLQSMSALLRQVLPNGISLSLAADPDLPPVRASRADLELAVMNIVLNARDAIVGSGTIWVSAHRECDTGTTQPQRVVLSVRDTGAGMTAAVRDRVFERFFTTRKSEGGTGIGLAIVRDTVQVMGGSVEIQSVPDVGTLVRLVLPVRTPLEVVRHRGAAPEERASGHKVLVCCGSTVLGGCVADFLRRGRFSILEADDADCAAELCEEFADDIALAIVDLSLPEMTGPDLAQRMRESGVATPVIFLADCTEASRCIAAGVEPCDRVLNAPFSPDQLGALVRELITDCDLPEAASVH
jgi:signal transduction histidine kinase